MNSRDSDRLPRRYSETLPLINVYPESSMTAPKNTRVTNVQIPGAAPAPVAAAPAPEAPVAKTADPEPEPAPAAAVSGSFQPEADEFSMDEMRARIREEERAILRDELNAQMQAASKAIEDTVGNSAAQLNKTDYRNMRAADIDPSTLVAAVLTRDGYLCPPSPEAKK
jgi:hypothetical protein